jgi:hypothetical protein
MVDLLALAERCEAAPFQDRKLSCDIGAATGEQFSRAFTSSIDAAMTLVPEGFLWCTGIAENYGDDDNFKPAWGNVRLPSDSRLQIDVSRNAAIPALALCAAALRARAALTEQPRTSERT